jgi:hypothetical protein
MPDAVVVKNEPPQFPFYIRLLHAKVIQYSGQRYGFEIININAHIDVHFVADVPDSPVLMNMPTDYKVYMVEAPTPAGVMGYVDVEPLAPKKDPIRHVLKERVSVVVPAHKQEMTIHLGQEFFGVHTLAEITYAYEGIALLYHSVMVCNDMVFHVFQAIKLPVLQYVFESEMVVTP